MYYREKSNSYNSSRSSSSSSSSSSSQTSGKKQTIISLDEHQKCYSHVGFNKKNNEDLLSAFVA